MFICTIMLLAFARISCNNSSVSEEEEWTGNIVEYLKGHANDFINASMNEQKTCFKKTI